MGKSTLSMGVAERDGGPHMALVAAEQGMVASPKARRLSRPRWRDHRLMIGVLLVVICVVIGARVVAAADRSRSWISVRSDLPAGHVLTASDLTTTSGRLVPAAAGIFKFAGLSRRWIRAGDVRADCALPGEAFAIARAHRKFQMFLDLECFF